MPSSNKRKSRLRGKSNEGSTRLCLMLCFAFVMFMMLHVCMNWWTPSRTSTRLESSTRRPPVLREESVWKTFRDPSSGELYYYNHVTGVTTWDSPFEDVTKQNSCNVRENVDFLGGDLSNNNNLRIHTVLVKKHTKLKNIQFFYRETVCSK